MLADGHSGLLVETTRLSRGSRGWCQSCLCGSLPTPGFMLEDHLPRVDVGVDVDVDLGASLSYHSGCSASLLMGGCFFLLRKRHHHP